VLLYILIFNYLFINARELIASPQFSSFAAENPNVEFVVEKKRGKHPHLKGTFCTFYSFALQLSSQPSNFMHACST